MSSSPPPASGSLPAADRSTDRRALVAVDLGAESCRVSLLRWTEGEAPPALRLVHRFANGPVRASDGTLRWPLRHILAGVDDGIRRCAALAPEGIRSIAVDGWAVDYVRLAHDAEVLDEPFCYRDERAITAFAELHRVLAPERLRAVTGIEQQPLNTLYQLYADRLAGQQQARWLNLPEYLLHRWGGEAVAEYTNASHTQLLNLHTGSWSSEIFDGAGLDITCASRIVPPGTIVGRLSGPLASVPGLDETLLIAPACHDTASAIAGIAATGDDWAYISSGTWSLVGKLVSEPQLSPAAHQDNFTNLGAVGDLVCFHKSVNGMWLLKQCMEEWAARGHPWSLPALLEAADAEPTPDHLLHVDAPSLLGVGGMPDRINAQRLASGLPALSTESRHAPALISLILHSLAHRYAQVLARVETHTGRPLRRVIMVGGGAQNKTLRRLTAQHTGLEVMAGPSESSTIGNFAVQLAALEETATGAPAGFAGRVAWWAQQLRSAEFQAS